VVTLDRRKLAAPVAAQAAAFVVVLVIGIFHGHTTKTPAPAHSASPGARPAASAAGSGTPAAAQGQSAKLTVTVTEEISGGLTVAGSQVRVLRDGTSAVAASGTLSPARQFAANLPAGAYQVCVNPVGFVSAVPGTHLIHGFICAPATVGSAPQSVTFHVVPKTTQAAA
jgi:hypothetical protein